MAPFDTVLQKGAPKNGIQHKWHLTATLLVFWSTTNILITIRHWRVRGISFWSAKNLTLKFHYHESESYIKFKFPFKNHSAQSLANRVTFWAFVCKAYHFSKALFFWVSYLSISGGVFVMCCFYMMPWFSSCIKGCHFCWGYLMVIKLLPVLWRETSSKTWNLEVSYVVKDRLIYNCSDLKLDLFCYIYETLWN